MTTLTFASAPADTLATDMETQQQENETVWEEEHAGDTEWMAHDQEPEENDGDGDSQPEEGEAEPDPGPHTVGTPEEYPHIYEHGFFTYVPADVLPWWGHDDLRAFDTYPGNLIERIIEHDRGCITAYGAGIPPDIIMLWLVMPNGDPHCPTLGDGETHNVHYFTPPNIPQLTPPALFAQILEYLPAGAVPQTATLGGTPQGPQTAGTPAGTPAARNPSLMAQIKADAEKRRMENPTVTIDMALGITAYVDPEERLRMAEYIPWAKSLGQNFVDPMITP